MFSDILRIITKFIHHFHYNQFFCTTSQLINKLKLNNQSGTNRQNHKEQCVCLTQFSLFILFAPFTLSAALNSESSSGRSLFSRFFILINIKGKEGQLFCDHRNSEVRLTVATFNGCIWLLCENRLTPLTTENQIMATGALQLASWQSGC